MISKVKSVVFRLDFGKEVGLGHLSRCSYLARTLESLGYRTILMFGPNTKGSRNLSRHFLEAFSAYEMLSGSDASVIRAERFFLERISQCAPDLLILDHYAASSEFVAALRQLTPVLAIDDGEQSLDVDYSVAYGGVPTTRASDKRLLSGRLVGSKFALVTGNSEFRIEDVPREQAAVIVSLGGGRTSGQAVSVAEAILPQMGAAYGFLTATGLRSYGSSFIGPKKTFRPKPGFSLNELLSKSQRAIVTGGVSLVEALAQGTPPVAIVTAQNQLNGLIGLRDLSDLMVAESLEFFSSEGFRIWWARYEDITERKRAELELRSVVDSFGPLRVAVTVGLTGNNSASLRRASEADLPILLRWRRELDPNSGRARLGEIDATEHLEWFQRMEKEGATIWIYEISGLPVGQVRLHKDHKLQRVVLSYSVDELFRGRGLGAAMLGQLVSAGDFPKAVWARVHSTNLPSLRILSVCGFRPQNQDNDGFEWMLRSPTVSGSV